MGFAIGSEDLGDGPPLTARDFLIQVQERPTQFFRQAPAHRSFSGAHEANQVNASMCHSVILAEGKEHKKHKRHKKRRLFLCLLCFLCSFLFFAYEVCPACVLKWSWPSCENRTQKA
jgi:hypothetical protein